MDRLDPRKRSILQAVVLEYVQGAEPVASELISTKYDLRVSSATIRNELAEMSELGFLEKPHTSAGRIPSDEGYRYYVDFISQPRQPDNADQNKVKGVAEDGDTLQELLRESTKLLARVTQLLSAATVARNTQVRVKHAVITALGPESGLMVFVLSNGHVENRLIELPVGTTLEQMGHVNAKIKELTDAKPLARLTNLKSPPNTDKLTQLATTTIRTIAKDLTKGTVITEGAEFLFGQPEFKRDSGLLSQLVGTLDDQNSFYQALTGTGSHVSIGKENSDAQLKPFTIIRRTFFVGDQEAGTIAIIGPTRLNYDQGISLVEFTAQAVSDTLTKMLK
ncbi:MAG: heat-inducible transcriptional repressor HrcA [Armatimonadetes bacterium]|nr:heat-inducible transcriptional repressor HrcA [Armatimonadota bacterium]